MTVVLAACSSQSEHKPAALPSLSQPFDAHPLLSVGGNRGDMSINNYILDEPISAVLVSLRCASTSGTVLLQVGIPVNQDPAQNNEDRPEPDLALQHHFDASVTCTASNKIEDFRFDLPQEAQVVTARVEAGDATWGAEVAASKN